MRFVAGSQALAVGEGRRQAQVRTAPVIAPKMERPLASSERPPVDWSARGPDEALAMGRPSSAVEASLREGVDLHDLRVLHHELDAAVLQ